MAGKGTSSLEKVLEAQDVIKNVHEVSKLLDADLDPKTLVLSMRLIENGANPTALAKLIKDIKRYVHTLEEKEKKSNCKEHK